MILLSVSADDSIAVIIYIILFLAIVVPVIIRYEFKQVDKREAQYKHDINEQDLYDRWG